MLNKILPHIEARNLLTECGLDEITDVQMDLFIAGLNVIYSEEPLSNFDGKIIFGESKTLIKVNSKIQFDERKRHVAAHEIGHFIMHKGMLLPDDTFANFNIIEGMEKTLVSGKQELEANQFARELLMPYNLFMQEAKSKKFSPALITQLSHRFKTSLTATVFRYLDMNLHPICIFFIDNGKVKYWKRSENFIYWPKDHNRLAPPLDSIAKEYIQSGYSSIYSSEELMQQIEKSTWFTLNDNDEDSVDFFEYCICSKTYKLIVSVVWQN